MSPYWRVVDSLRRPCCCRKGCRRSLRKRLNAAFRKDIKADVSLWRRLGNTKYQLFNWGTKHNSRKAHKSRDRKAAASVYLRVASRKRSAKVADEGFTRTKNGHETGLQKADVDATALEVQLSTSSIRHGTREGQPRPKKGEIEPSIPSRLEETV